MKKIYSLLLAISISLSLSAQYPLEWQRCLGGSQQERSKVIVEAQNGDLFIGSETLSNDGDVSFNHGNDNSDAWLVRLSPDGNIIWEKSYGGSGGEDIRGIIATDDGGCIITGGTSSWDGDFPPSNGQVDVFVAKIDVDGNIVWANTYGGSLIDGGQKIILTSDGNYLLTGYAMSSDGDVSANNGYIDFWVIKLTPTGIIIWEKCYGGSNAEFSTGLVEVTDGYIIVGETESNDGDVVGNNGLYDAWIIKIDYDGNLIWQKCLGGTNDEYGMMVLPASDGGFVLSASTKSHNGDVVGNIASEIAMWLVNFDPANGEIIWQKCYSGNNYEKNYDICPSIDGGYLLTGLSWSEDGSVTGNHGNGDYWQVKVSVDGVLEWEHCLGGSGTDNPRSILQTEDGAIYTLGYSDSNDGDVLGNHGYFDVWITKEWLNTSIAEELKTKMTLSPNPASNLINIDLGEMNEVVFNVIISDQLGKTVKTIDRLSVESSHIDISELNNGIYFINLFDENSENKWTSKFVKQ